jgi:hypothetical protein
MGCRALHHIDNIYLVILFRLFRFVSFRSFSFHCLNSFHPYLQEHEVLTLWSCDLLYSYYNFSPSDPLIGASTIWSTP